MANIKVMIDGKEYTLDQFRRDAIRMFDYYRTKGSDYMGKIDCKNVPCNDCPLSNKGCTTTKLRTFETIETVYNWTQKHPVVTNLDKLKELFGLWIEPAIVIGSEDEDEDEAENPLHFEFLFMKTGDYTVLTQLEEKDDTFWNWLNEEYKEPKGENKNDD